MSRRSVRMFLSACAAACAIALLAMAGLAAEKKSSTKDAAPAKSTASTPAAAGAAANPAEAHQKEMMEMMAKMAAPGPAHEHLKACVGSWKATVKTFMGGPEPTVSEGTSEMHMTLGDRFLEQSYKGTFMKQPFEGHGLVGYDNQKGVYQSVWTDNMTTSMMVSEGTWDDATKSLTSKAMMAGPDGKPGEVRTVMKMVDATTMTYSMYAPMNGQDQLMMEITYKKQ